MRWPLRNQIFIRLLLLMLATIAVITYANIQTTLSANHQRESDRVTKIGQLVSSPGFPLMSTTLETMRKLSGAEFLVTDREGTIVERTNTAPAFEKDNLTVADQPIFASSADQEFLYLVVPTNARGAGPDVVLSEVHIFVPQESRATVWWNASKSPILIAGIATPIALLISLALAGQVTQPLARLKSQVTEIASGNVVEITPSTRNDEVGDLSIAVNEMARQLKDHDTQVRQNERLRTLLQVGSGIAHNLRNASTGCKMAIELLGNENPDVANSDNIEVARRQLNLMENYIQKFMRLAERDIETDRSCDTEVDLAEVLDQVLFLVAPSARHLKVELETQRIEHSVPATMDAEDAQQMMVNLISNAIHAASQHAINEDHDATVNVSLTTDEQNQVTFSVTDNGAGPPDEIAHQLFQPFVSGSQEGTGLGLSLVKEIADRAGGTIQWNRQDGQTCFAFQLGKMRAESSPKPKTQE